MFGIAEVLALMEARPGAVDAGSRPVAPAPRSVLDGDPIPLAHHYSLRAHMELARCRTVDHNGDTRHFHMYSREDFQVLLESGGKRRCCAYCVQFLNEQIKLMNHELRSGD